MLTQLLPVAAMLFVACGQRPVSVELQPKNIDLGKKGETKSIVATVKDKNDKPIAKAKVVWSSSNDKIATVDATGKVTAVSTGTAIIKASAEDINGQIPAAVVVPKVLEIKPDKFLLRGPGTTQDLTVKVTSDKGDALPGLKIEWVSDNPAVATVADFKVTAVADGVAKISAKAGDASSTAVLVVQSPKPTRITIEPPKVVVKVGNTEQLSAQVYDDQNAAMPKAVVSWASSDPPIATVDSATGLVKGIKRGNTTATATVGPVTADVIVAVK